jgi:hypothetical protein
MDSVGSLGNGVFILETGIEVSYSLIRGRQLVQLGQRNAAHRHTGVLTVWKCFRLLSTIQN